MTSLTSKLRPGSLWVLAGKMVAVLRLKPFDTSTPGGRSRERYRRASLSGLSGVGERGLTVLTTLISIPLALGYLGTERYGLWLTITSVIALLTFADLGIGNGLLNVLSEAYGKNDRAAAQRYVASGFLILGAVAAALLVVFAGLYPLVPWPRLFNVASDIAAWEAGPATAVLAGCFAVNILLSVVQRVQMGFQEAYANHLWQGIGNILGLAGLLLVIHLEAGLPWLVLVVASGPILAQLCNGALLFGLRKPWLRPRIRNAAAADARRIIRTGLLFFVLQLASVVALQSDNIIIAQLLGADQVSQYAIPMKMIMFVPLLLGVGYIVLWPAYGESIARGETAWVRRTFTASLILGLSVNVPAVGILVWIGKDILRLWIGGEIMPSAILLAGLGLWSVIYSISMALAMVLNAYNVVRFQVVCATTMAITNIALSIFLVGLIGLPGAVFGSIAAHVIFVLIPYSVYVRRLLVA
ncbi:MAG: oligosaccharide flippase family protein [Proteobacteria bacterium]|nr:oligosaccharide flippase family protein [Pseudomonadota bacterium]